MNIYAELVGNHKGPIYMMPKNFCPLKFVYRQGFRLHVTYISVQTFVLLAVRKLILLGARASCELVQTNTCAVPCTCEAYPNKHSSGIRIKICADQNFPPPCKRGLEFP